MLKLDPQNTELLRQKQDVLNKSIDETRNKLTMLKEAKDEADKKMTEGTKINEENYRALQREIINTESKLKQLELSNDSFYKMGKKVEEFGNKINAVSEKINSLGNKLTTRLTLPITAIATAGISYNAQLEKYTKSFETFLGDAEKASKAVEKIKEDSAKTPFDVTSLVQANQMLISTGENAKGAREVILALGDAVTATGGGNDELTRMAANLQQVKNAGKATALDIKQFAYAGIDIYGLLADYTGKSVQEVKDMEISYEVLTEALKKAGKQGGKYYNAMNDASETLTGQVNQLKAEIKDMAGQLTKSLMPTAKKLVGQAKDLISKFDNLSDSQKENIVKIGLWVAAAGPLLKIIGTLGKTIGTTAKGIGTFAQAVGVMANGTKSSNEAVNNLAKGLKGIVSPAGLATLGVTAFVAALALVKSQVDKEYKGLTKLNEELKNNNEARKSAIEQIENQRNASLGEINNIEKLKNELKLLVDENGKVKEGYETRAKFILNELNNALETEYSMTGDIIDNYETLMETIDDLMAKKKAQIILEANEASYKEAIQQKDSLYKDYIKTQEELAERVKRFNELEEESKRGFIGSKQSLAKNTTEMRKLSEEIVNLTDNLSNEKQTLEKYSTEIEKYEKNSELMLEGGIENYKKIEESVSTTQDNITKLANAGLNERLQAQIKANEQSKKEYALEAQYNEDVKNSIYATNVKKGQENLKLLSEELIARTSTVNTLGEDEKEAWKTLAQGSYDEYDKALSKMPISMKNKIIEMTGIASRDTTVEEATKQLGEDAHKGFNNNVDGNKWGIDLISLISGGMTSLQSKNSIFSAAGKVAGWISSYLHFSVPEKGPLSDMDKSMPDMINLMAKGIEKNKQKLLSSTQLLANDLNNSLKVSGNILNNSSLKTNTIFTTPNITFNVQKMDEANLNTAFNYINKRLGSQY